MAVNWRSDADLLRAFNVLFEGATLGGDAIAYQHVEAVPKHRESRLLGAPAPAPLRLRIVRTDADVRTTASKKLVLANSGREFVARDVAAQIVDMLNGGAQIVDASPQRPEPSEQHVRPADLAVLVRKNAEATLVQQALRDAGVPAVINGVGSVFETPAAREWLRLLQALERPSDLRRARSAALTAFLGWSANRLDATTEVAWEQVHLTLHRWAEILRGHSVAALWQTVRVEERLPQRLLSEAGGERLITDLDHIGDLLHAATMGGDRAATGLAAWLTTRIAEADTDAEATERARRLESDAEAVQVLTIHRSKGLEFPIVYCPFLWLPSWFDRRGVPVFHDEEIDDGRLIANVGGPGGDYKVHQSRAKREQRDEDLRLMYVALTRARHQVVVWWTPGYEGEESPLSPAAVLPKGPDRACEHPLQKGDARQDRRGHHRSASATGGSHRRGNGG